MVNWDKRPEILGAEARYDQTPEEKARGERRNAPHGGFCASYTTLDALERALRARAGL